MNHRSSFLTWCATALFIAAIAGLWWAGYFERGGGADSLEVAREAGSLEVSAESLELGPGAAESSVPADPNLLASGPAAERAAIGEPAATLDQELTEPSAPMIPLHGVVLDPLGHNVPNVIVEWVADPAFAGNDVQQGEVIPDSVAPGQDSVAPGPRIGGPGRFGRGGVAPSTVSPGGTVSVSQDLGAVIRLNDPNAWSRGGGPLHPRVRTDANGAFEFPDVPARSEGTLRFGHELFLGWPPSQPVIPDGGEQSLFLPARPASTPQVRITLRDSETGRELFPDRVEARLAGLPSVLLDAEGEELPRRALKQPRPDQIALGSGWVELQLWPGTWLVELSTALSETVELKFQVPSSGPLVQLEAALRTFDPERGWEPLSPVAEAGFAPQPETAEGFDQFGADKSPTRQIGERNSDRTFRHTLRFGVGEVSAAYLELDLEALSGMAYNDSLGLEFYAGPRFGFSQRISAFTGGEWRSPNRRRLMLDLSKLPGAGGSVNLLSDLADGRLDVYVQDDTAVYDVRLFVQR